MKKGLLKLIALLGYRLEKNYESNPNPIRPWQNSDFANKYNSVKNNTLLDPIRCYMLIQYAKQTLSLKGDMAEVGVYKGGTAKLIAEIAAEGNKTVYLFDTFLGMPETNPLYDFHKKGDFNDATIYDVKKYLSMYDNISIYPGLFPDTAKSITGKTFCFAHIDVDIYTSVFDCCEYFYKRLVPYGIMVFDDYGFITCPGAKKAVDIFFEDKPEKPQYIPSGQAIIIKR